jgi:hypothetical protein
LLYLFLNWFNLCSISLFALWCEHCWYWQTRLDCSTMSWKQLRVRFHDMVPKAEVGRGHSTMSWKQTHVCFHDMFQNAQVGRGHQDHWWNDTVVRIFSQRKTQIYIACGRTHAYLLGKWWLHPEFILIPVSHQMNFYLEFFEFTQLKDLALQDPYQDCSHILYYNHNISLEHPS